MPINERDDSGLEELGTPADIRAPHEPDPVVRLKRKYGRDSRPA